MSLIADIRNITEAAIGKFRDAEEKIELHKAQKPNLSDALYARIMQELQEELEELHREYLREVRARVEKYKEDVAKRECLDSSKLTEDAAFLSGAYQLKASDLDDLMKRNKGNRTMERLIYGYATERGLEQAMTQRFYTAEQKTTAAEEFLNSYARGVSARPEYYDIWGSDKYFNEATPEAIKGE